MFKYRNAVIIFVSKLYVIVYKLLVFLRMPLTKCQLRSNSSTIWGDSGGERLARLNRILSASCPMSIHSFFCPWYSLYKKNTQCTSALLTSAHTLCFCAVYTKTKMIVTLISQHVHTLLGNPCLAISDDSNAAVFHCSSGLQDLMQLHWLTIT